jgi:hypothetical protein
VGAYRLSLAHSMPRFTIVIACGMSKTSAVWPSDV